MGHRCDRPWKRSHTFVAEDLSVLSETDAPHADLSGTVPDLSRRIRNADEPCRRRDGGDGRPHGCTAASSTANYGPGAPGWFGGRPRLTLDASRTHAATGVGARTRGAASRCRAACRAPTETTRSPHPSQAPVALRGDSAQADGPPPRRAGRGGPYRPSL